MARRIMTETLHPLGHPVRISSDNARVLEVAREKWGEWRKRFAGAAIEFAVEVGEGTAGDGARFQALAGGFLLCGSGGDRAGYSVERRSGWARLSRTTVEGDRFWWDYLQPLVITALDWSYFQPVHAGCVMRGGRTVLLCGDSGAGKSTLAYACGRAGWTVVSDDASHWALADRVIVPGKRRMHLREAARDLFPELAGGEVKRTENGKWAIEVCPREAGFAVAEEAPLGPLVFLERRAGRAEMIREEESAAREYLRSYCPRPACDLGALLDCGVWRLRYERVEDAVAALERLA